MNSLEKVVLALSEYLKERDEEERVRNQEEKIRHEELLEVLGDIKNKIGALNALENPWIKSNNKVSKEKVKTEVTEVCNETDKKNINANLTLFPNEKKMEEPKTLVISEEIYDPRSEEEERLIQQKIEEIKIKVNAFIGKIPNLETVPALVYRKLALDVKDDYGVEEALYALKVKGAIQRYDEAEKLRKETEERRIIDEHRVKGFDLFAPPIDFKHIEGVTNTNPDFDSNMNRFNNGTEQKTNNGFQNNNCFNFSNKQQFSNGW